MPSVNISSYQKVVAGKVVNVNAYQVHRDAGGRSLAIPGRPIMFAKQGQFPGGRSTPNIYPVPTIHGGNDGSVAPKAASGAEEVSRAGGEIGSGAGSVSDRAAQRVERAVASAQEKAALVAYTGSKYREIQAAAAKAHVNAQVGSDIQGRRADPIALVAHLDNLLARAIIKTGTTGYKVAQLASAPTVQPGAVLKVPTFSSLVPSQQTAESLVAGSEAALFAVSIPAGSRGLRVGDTVKQGGDELILPRNSQFKIVSDEVEDGQRVIHADYIEPPENVVTNEEASKATERAFASLKAKQSGNKKPA